MMTISWNRCVQTLAHIHPRRGYLARFLRPRIETTDKLFGRYRFTMDLSLGYLQQVYYLKLDNYEMATQNALRSLIRPGMVVLDIGANSGYISILMADLVGPGGHVHSFEPSSTTFALLEKNVRSNNLPQLQCHRLALSDKNGSALLSLDYANDGANSLGDLTKNSTSSHQSPIRTEEVPTLTLDTFLDQMKIGHVDVVKVDIEGAEMLLFAGAHKLLSRPDAPAILCEVSEENQKQCGQTERALREQLYQFGYEAFRLQHDYPALPRHEPVLGVENILFRKKVTGP